MRWLLTVALLCGGTQVVADEGKEFLRKFHQNPRQWMDKELTKYRRDGKPATKLQRWPKHTLAFKVHNAEIKNAIDPMILGEGKQGWEAHDNPRYLFEASNRIESNITKLPTQGELKFTPWSSDHWPFAKGGVSLRYADPDFEDMYQKEKGNYEKVITYYQQPDDFVSLPPTGENRQQKLNMYSPAEKYDLLVGSSDFKLTNLTKEQGRRYVGEDGTVPWWMGICHGWAVAAYASPRPANTITVMAADGKTKIEFHPDDVRALVSLKWAYSSWDGMFIGGRCNAKENADEDEEAVEKDEETGRVLNEECFDTNPGTWHTVVTNKIGRYNESFIMDITFDAEVWNQPVYAYDVSYHHPRTYEPGTLEESIMTIDKQWQEEDTFAAFRNNPQAKKIVIVKMDVTYVAETDPRHGVPHEDKLKVVTYWYDLELDEDNNIVGGEWYTNRHPDFLWTKKRNSRPQNTVDRTISRLLDEKKTVQEFAKTGNMSVFNQALLGRLAELSDLSLRMDNTPLELVIYGLVEMAK